MRILLAEDDELLGSGIRAGLAQHGFQVDWVRDGVAAERELATGAYQAAVLDLGLPRQDGMEVLRQTRARRNTTPVLVLTARDAVPARIEGLDAGADDYLIKPIACTSWPPACAPWCAAPMGKATPAWLRAMWCWTLLHTRCWPTASLWYCPTANTTCCTS